MVSGSLAALRAKQATTDLTGKVAVVVGGTSGIGEGCAMRLAESKADVVIVGRSETHGQEILKQLKIKSGQDCGFVRCDAFQLSNVKAASDTIATMRPQGIDYLVMSQGMSTLQGRTETAEGLDQKLALHYYSRAAFAHALAPLLKKRPDPRVLSVLSAGVHSAYGRYRDDPDLRKHYGLKNAADIAGFYNDLAADFMSELHAPIKFIHAAPGIVDTRWGDTLPWAARGAFRVLAKVFAKSKADCAEYMCSALFRDDLFKDGRRFYLMKEDGSEAKPTPKHAEARDFVRQHTLEVLTRLMN